MAQHIGAGDKTRLESSMKKFKPHVMFFFFPRNPVLGVSCRAPKPLLYRLSMQRTVVTTALSARGPSAAALRPVSEQLTKRPAFSPWHVMWFLLDCPA